MGASESINDASAMARREVLHTIGRALWKFRRRTLAALGLLVLAKLFMVLVPVALKEIVDTLDNPNGALVLPSFLLLGYAALRFFGGLFTELRDVAFALVMQTTIADFTVRIFAHLHALAVQFHISRQTGALSRDVSRGTTSVGFLLGAALFTVLPTIIEIVSVVLILMIGYRLGFAGIVAITFIAYGTFTTVFTEKRIMLQRRLNELDSLANGQLVDSLLNFETVKFYASADAEAHRLSTLLDGWIKVGLANQKALSVLHTGQSGIIAFGVGAVMLLAGQEVVQGRMTVGDLVLVNAYIIQICLPLNTLGLVFRQAREALINAERLAELLRQPPEVDPAKELPPLELHGGEVDFQNVSFSYEPGRPILQGIELHIEPGKTVAVVGGSGSGKSTLARLLLRFYDVNSGSVSVDGQDVRSVSVDSLRKAIGIVPQDTMLFNNTIAYNIAYGRAGASLDEVTQAAKAACVHDFIQSLPAQYETRVGERGVKLSGGERQRIAIARALLKNPPLLIFDEATSALDTRTERAIQTQLDEVAQGRTTLIIAHRLSTVVAADAILVMEQGRVVERGTHDELLRANKLYAHMWKLQRQQNRTQEEGARLSAQPVNLVTLAAGVLDAVRPLIEEKSINLYTLIGGETSRVTADPGVLQQIVWELCINAIVATPARGRMELRLDRNGQAARLSIHDGRRRVPPSTAAPEAASAPELAAESAAEPGTTPPAPDEPVWQSTAMHVPPDPDRIGALIEQMGGKFHFELPTSDIGMTFVIELPLRAVASLSPPTSIDHALTDSLRGLKIFVADDQAEARELLGEALRDHGAIVASFSSGAQVLAELANSATESWPDVLLCDIGLGEIDGYAVITQIRRLEAERGVSLSQRLPAVALSGYAGQEDRLRALLAGFQLYIDKPVDPRELVATVSAVARAP